MSKTIIVRVMVPQEGQGLPSSFVGHYDMQIVGNNISFMNEYFNDPVFSFGPYNDDIGALHVFNGNQSFSVYKENSNYEKCDVYKWTTVVSDEQYKKLINYFHIVLSGVMEKTSSGIYCVFTSCNLFRKYHMSYVNCYRAVATWLKVMGIDTLWNIFANAYPEHLKYSSAAMVEKFAVSGKWEKVASV